jgi:hypothetical protein
MSVLAAACRCSSDAIHALLAEAGALVIASEAAPTPRFVHGALGAALLSSLDDGARRRLHAELGAALDVVHGSIALQEVTHHLLAAMPDSPVETVGRFVLRAADSCGAARDPQTVRRLCETALTGFPPASSPTPLQVDLLIRLARAQAQLGAVDTAEQVWRTALAAVLALDDPERYALVVLAHDWTRRTVLADSGDSDLLSDALSRLGSGPSALRVRLASTLLAEAAVPGRVRQLGSLAEEVRESARAVGDQLAYVTALHAQHVLLRASPHAQRRGEVAAQLAVAAERLGDPYWDGVAELAGLFDAFVEGRGSAIAGRLDALRRAADLAGNPRLSWHRLLAESSAHRQAGRFAKADQYAEEAVVHGAAVGIPDAVAAMLLHRYLVDLATAGVASHVAVIHQFVAEQPGNILARAALGLAAAQAGDPVPAERSFRAVLDALAASAFDEEHLMSLVFTAETQALLGHAERCAELRPLMEPYRGQFVVFGQVTGTHGPVDRALAVVDMAVGAWDSARVLLDSAERLSATAGSLPWIVRCGADRVRLLRAQGSCKTADDLSATLWESATRLRLAPCLADLAATGR